MVMNLFNNEKYNFKNITEEKSNRSNITFKFELRFREYLIKSMVYQNLISS
jgi:hypothetical protein